MGGFADIPRMQDTELTERIRNSSGTQLGFEPSVVGYQIQDSNLKKVLKKIYITGNNIYFLRYQNKSSKVNALHQPSQPNIEESPALAAALP